MSSPNGSPRTLLGPLTTRWAPPGVCSYAMALCETCTSIWRAQTCNPSSDAHDDTECWPPRASYATTNAGVLMGYGFYSPGIVCPDGYTTAALATEGGHTGWGLEYSLEQGETAAACCPSGFTPSYIEATDTYAQTCVVTATSTTLETVMCDLGTYSGFSELTVPLTLDGNDVSSYVVFAPLIQLNFKSSDITTTTVPSTTSKTAATAGSTGQSLPSSTTGSTTSMAAGATTASSQSSSSSTQSIPSSGSSSGSSSGPSQSGLSTGAKIGIGVGVGVGGLILVALAILLLLRRRRNKPAQVGAAPTAAGAAKGKPETNPLQAELGSEDVKEMAQTPFRRGMGSMTRRLPGNGAVYELPAEATPR